MVNVQDFNERGLENLCIALVKQAAEDYATAYCSMKKAGSVAAYEDFASRAKVLEDFFKDSVFVTYMRANGEAIMQQIRRDAKQCDYNRRELWKLYHLRSRNWYKRMENYD